jgi:hypothetical protein
MEPDDIIRYERIRASDPLAHHSSREELAAARKVRQALIRA